jgi:hypothetical protein
VNYIDRVAQRIYQRTEGTERIPADEIGLYRIYAVLCLVKGVHTSLRDVHDAWSAWRVVTKPDHRSLVPFEQLTPDVQALDAPYRDAIQAVAVQGRLGTPG